ncbi:unnamed protein product [Mytilus edulis]|uniref:NADAR domain-containing protein n=1 Tax=Mytilus edulis TaxID=6550 RepID=A0A8S3UZS9_MYTED|nr:unnamed protein product [Mytilus edulis]
MQELLHQIKQLSDSKKAKMLSKKLKTRKSWEDQKPLVMAEILKLKFLQCKAFRDRLTSTSGYINHNVPDEFWGTGRKGKGKNVFGLLLAALRLGIGGVIGSKPRDVKHTTKSESLLLQTYGQAMPDPINTGSFRSVRDEVSTGILRRYHPVVLEELYPAKIPGDGKVFPRTMTDKPVPCAGYLSSYKFFTINSK